MKCEEFEATGLGIERDATASAAEQAAAREHASTCSQCAALQDSWLAAKLELSALAETTRAAETPGRVEMRLRQEFRMRRRTMPARRAAVIAAWALATAALVLGAVSWRNWRVAQHDRITKQEISTPSLPLRSPAAGTGGPAGATPSLEPQLAAHVRTRSVKRQLPRTAAEATADRDRGAFTLLPGSFATEMDDTAIVRVRLQRGALGALGFPVNEERAGEWVQVDLLVGNDGLPQAVRIPR